MKKYLRLISLLFIGILTFSFSMPCSAQKTFGDLASIKGVSSVYIGKTMLKMASSINLGDISVSGIDITKLTSKLTSIEILSCDGKKLVKKVSKKADKIIKKIPLETISDFNRDGSIVDISGIYKPDREVLTTLLVKVLQPDTKLTIVLLKGEIDMESLQAALAD